MIYKRPGSEVIQIAIFKKIIFAHVYLVKRNADAHY